MIQASGPFGIDRGTPSRVIKKTRYQLWLRPLWKSVAFIAVGVKGYPLKCPRLGPRTGWGAAVRFRGGIYIQQIPQVTTREDTIEYKRHTKEDYKPLHEGIHCGLHQHPGAEKHPEKKPYYTFCITNIALYHSQIPVSDAIELPVYTTGRQDRITVPACQ